MATSGDIYTNYFSEEYGSVRLKYHWAISGNQSIDNNTTTIAWTITTDGSMTSGYWYKAGPIVMTMTATNGSFTSGSNSYSNSSRIQLRGGGTQVAAGTAILTHNATGVGSFSVSMSAAIYYTSTNVSGSGTASLPNIPRATTPVFKIGNNIITEVDIGTEFTIELPRASDSFTHTVKYSFGSLSNESIGTNLGASKSWTPSVDLGPQIPNSTSGVCTITCETYSGQTLIGTTNKAITLKAPVSWVPTNTTSFSSTKGALGYIDIISAVNAAVTYGGSNGSTVTSVSLTFQGKTYEGTLTENGTSVTITSDLCSGSGNAVAVKTRVTDSRGRYNESSTSLTVLAYSLPSVTLALTRTLEADGTNQNETGSYMRLTLTCSVANITGNSVSSISASYKIGSGSSTPISISSLPYDSASGSNNISVANSSSCTVTVTITDTAGGTTSVIQTLPVGFKTLDFLAGGKGINIGSTAVNENLAINRDIMLGGKVYRKNLIQKNTSTCYGTDRTVVFSDNGDGGILINGTNSSSGTTAFKEFCKFKGIDGHQYILSSGPNASNDSYVYISGKSLNDKTGAGTLFTYTGSDEWSIRTGVPGGKTATNIVLYPMIRDAGVTDSTWEPYVPDYKDVFLGNEPWASGQKFTGAVNHIVGLASMDIIGAITNLWSVTMPRVICGQHAGTNDGNGNYTFTAEISSDFLNPGVFAFAVIAKGWSALSDSLSIFVFHGVQGGRYPGKTTIYRGVAVNPQNNNHAMAPDVTISTGTTTINGNSVPIITTPVTLTFNCGDSNGCGYAVIPLIGGGVDAASGTNNLIDIDSLSPYTS